MRPNRLAFSYPRKIVDHLLNLLILSGSVYCAQIHRLLLLLLLEVSIDLNTEKKSLSQPQRETELFYANPFKWEDEKNDEPTHNKKSMM